MKKQIHLIYQCIVSSYYILLLKVLSVRIILGALLSGARNCRDSVLSEKIYSRMKILFSDQKDALISGSILLGNTYSSLGNYEKAETIRSNRINEYGKKVRPGLAWTEVDGEIVVKRFLSIINKI